MRWKKSKKSRTFFQKTREKKRKRKVRFFQVFCIHLHSLQKNAAFFAFFYVLLKRTPHTLRSFTFFRKERNILLGFISCQKHKKECKRTLRSERKRTGWPALIFLHLIDKKHEFFSKKLCYWHGLGLWTTINKSTFILQVRLQGVVYGNTQWWDSGLPALCWSKDQPAWCGSGTGTKRCLWSCCPVRPGSWQQNFLWQLVHQLRSPRPYGRKGVGSPR